jgi:hypothetical protein
VVLRFTRPATELSIRRCFLEVERGRYVRLTALPPFVRDPEDPHDPRAGAAAAVIDIAVLL